MRPQKISDRELIDKLFAVFRAKGYSGARINELAALTGLKKASLYYRFPGGKEDIVKAVLVDMSAWSEKNIVGVLESPNLDADTRLEVTLSNINKLYGRGKKSCLFESLSLDDGLQLLGHEIKQSLRTWIRAFTTYGQSIGLNRIAAEKKANEVVTLIQGSLVVSRIMEDNSSWAEAMKRIEKLYNY
ncbi:MAG: TetR/AcrR family transcriptional regulator [Flavobacteriaceae bacterium]